MCFYVVNLETVSSYKVGYFITFLLIIWISLHVSGLMFTIIPIEQNYVIDPFREWIPKHIGLSALLRHVPHTSRSSYITCVVNHFGLYDTWFKYWRLFLPDLLQFEIVVHHYCSRCHYNNQSGAIVEIREDTFAKI